MGNLQSYLQIGDRPKHFITKAKSFQTKNFFLNAEFT